MTRLLYFNVLWSSKHVNYIKQTTFVIRLIIYHRQDRKYYITTKPGRCLLSPPRIEREHSKQQSMFNHSITPAGSTRKTVAQKSHSDTRRKYKNGLLTFWSCVLVNLLPYYKNHTRTEFILHIRCLRMLEVTQRRRARKRREKYATPCIFCFRATSPSYVRSACPAPQMKYHWSYMKVLFFVFKCKFCVFHVLKLK